MAATFHSPGSQENMARELATAKRKIAVLENDLESHRSRLEDAENVQTELEIALSFVEDPPLSQVRYEAGNLAKRTQDALSATRHIFESVRNFVESDDSIPGYSRQAILSYMEDNADYYHDTLPAAIEAQMAYHRCRTRVLRESRDRTELELLAIHDSSYELMKNPDPSGQEASQVVATVGAAIRAALIQLREINSQATADDSSGTGDELSNSSKLFNANFLGLPELLMEFKTAVESPVRDNATIQSLRRQLREAKEAQFGAERDMRASKIAMDMAKLEANIRRDLVGTSDNPDSRYNHLAGGLEECHQRGEERRLEIEQLRQQQKAAHHSNSSPMSEQHEEGDGPFSRGEARNVYNLLNNYTGNLHQYQSIVQSLEEYFEDLAQTAGLSRNDHLETAARSFRATLREQRDRWESEKSNLKSQIDKLNDQRTLDNINNEQFAELKAKIQAQQLDIERLQRQLDYYRVKAASVQAESLPEDPRSPSSDERVNGQLRKEIEKLEGDLKKASKEIEMHKRAYYRCMERHKSQVPSYGDLQDQFAEQTRREAQLQARLTEVQNRLQTGIKTDQAQLARIRGMQEQVEIMQAEGTRNEDSIRNLTHTLDEYRVDIDNLTARVTELNNQLGVMADERSDLQRQLDDCIKGRHHRRSRSEYESQQSANESSSSGSRSPSPSPVPSLSPDPMRPRPGIIPSLLGPVPRSVHALSSPDNNTVALPPNSSSGSDPSLFLSNDYPPSEPSPSLIRLAPISPSRCPPPLSHPNPRSQPLLHLANLRSSPGPAPRVELYSRSPTPPPPPPISPARPQPPPPDYSPPTAQAPILPNPPASRLRPSPIIPQQQASPLADTAQKPLAPPQTPTNQSKQPNTPAAPPRRQPRRAVKNLDPTYRPGRSLSPSESDDSLLSTPPNSPGGTKRQRAPGSRLREETRENKRRAKGWGVAVDVNTPESPTKHMAGGGKRK